MSNDSAPDPNPLAVSIDAVAAPTLIVDARGVIRAANEPAAKALGATAAELVGRPYDRVLVDAPDSCPWLETAGSGRRRYRGRGGAALEAEETVTPTVDGGAVVSFVDVGPLEEARRRARAAETAKAVFLQNLGHEIRTPLNAVSGFADLLAVALTADDHRRMAETIRTNAQGLVRLITDVLDLARLEEGRLELTTAPFSLGLLADGAVSGVAAGAAAKGLPVRVQWNAPASAIIIGDGPRLRQMLQHLLANAVKFTERGEVVLEIGLEPVSADEAVLITRVRDTGPGIAPEVMPTMFEPFRQGDESITRRYGGAGLGLAIVDALARRMDGDVHVETEVGVGSSFDLRIPVRLPIDPLQGAEAASAAPAEARLPGLVLIVEDDPSTMALIERILGRHGIRTAGVGNVDEALRTAAAEAPDGIVLDLHLAQGSHGWELLARLPSPRPPVIVTSFDPAARATLLAGAVAVLQKPVREADLMAAVTAHFGEPVGVVAGEGRVLLVEDSPVAVEVERRQLQRMGLEVEVAWNGLDALHRLDGDPDFDAVVLDMNMPVLDGYETARRIREHPVLSGIPIVAVTSYAARGDDRRCLEAGCDAYFAKPVDWAAARPTILRHVGKGRRRRASASPAAALKGADGMEQRLPVIDVDVARRIADNDEGLRLELLQIFIDTLEELTTSIGAAVNTGDPEEIYRAAHALKGAAANVGAQELAELAKDLELYGRGGESALAPGKAARIDEAVERFRAVAAGQLSG